jgi:hypothetical protein
VRSNWITDWREPAPHVKESSLAATQDGQPPAVEAAEGHVVVRNSLVSLHNARRPDSSFTIGSTLRY